MQADLEYDRTILVSGLPEGVTENTVHIHFQKKKNGGDNVEKVTLLAGGKATVVFENPKGLLIMKLMVFPNKLLPISTSVHANDAFCIGIQFLSSMITCKPRLEYT